MNIRIVLPNGQELTKCFMVMRGMISQIECADPIRLNAEIHLTDADRIQLGPPTTVMTMPSKKPANLNNAVAKMLSAVSWLKAEASVLIDGKLADADYEARIAACRACEHLSPLPEPQVGFCGGCGCGKSPRAELTVKGRMPAARCPKRKWPETQTPAR